MNETAIPATEPAVKQQGLYAKVGDGSWYPIPPNMKASFLAAGAEVVRAYAAAIKENGAVNFIQMIEIYRRSAVDHTATAVEGCDWWCEVQAEIEAIADNQHRRTRC